VEAHHGDTESTENDEKTHHRGHRGAQRKEGEKNEGATEIPPAILLPFVPSFFASSVFLRVLCGEKLALRLSPFR
jgi:hypothetical protein